MWPPTKHVMLQYIPYKIRSCRRTNFERSAEMDDVTEKKSPLD